MPSSEMKWGVGVGLMAVACGCKSAAPVHVLAGGPVAMAAGWVSASSRDGKVTLGVPTGWRAGADKVSTDPLALMPTQDNSVVDPELQRVQAGFDADAKREEQKALDALLQKGIVLNVINGSKPIPGETRTHYFVRVKHEDGNASWSDANEQERAYYAFPPHPEEVKLPIGKALKYASKEDMRDGGTVYKVSYVAIDGSRIYSLRFVTEENEDAIKSIAEQVAQTWRIKE